MQGVGVIPEPAQKRPAAGAARSRHEAAAAPARATALPYVPALDGLRALCLLAVLLFHSGFAWMSGGFLGVSTFFTLSGFLITSLLTAEHDAIGGIALGRFLSRRLRRLWPPAMLTITAVALSAGLWLPPVQRIRLPFDAIASLFSVLNWRFVNAEYAYSLIFTTPSPLQHFWSLAIEGQFYVVFPLLVGLALRAGGGVRGLAIACSLLTIASMSVGMVTGTLDEAQYRLYYGTDARAGEFLVGALLALASRYAAPPRGAWWDRAVRLGGIAAALLIALAWSRATIEDLWLYRGGFVAYAALSALVIAAAGRAGVIGAVLDRAPLRWIGRVSYGAYLYHWPIFLLVDDRRTDWHPAVLLAVRVALTLAAAGVSYRFVERPIRDRRVLRGSQLWWAAAGSVAAAAAVAALASPIPVGLQLRVLAKSARAMLDGDRVASAAPRYAMFGDSTALSLWSGLGPWLRVDGGAAPVKGLVTLGCGVLAFGERENRGKWASELKTCAEIPARWRDTVRANRPDLAVVLIGAWEVRNRRVSPDEPVLAPGDPELDDALRKAIAGAADALSAGGAVVVWLTSPHIRVAPLGGKVFASDRASSEPERIDRLNEIIREVAHARPERMRVVDLAGYLRRWPGGEFDESLRADGVHFSAPGAAEIARDWLGPELLRVEREIRAAKEPAG